MRLLLFNLATNADDPILGFTTCWINALSKWVEVIHVITMRAGRIDVPENVRIYSVGKEKGYSEPRRAMEFYRHLFRVLHNDRIDVCFSHMIPIFTVLAAPVLKVRGIPIITWFAHPSLTWILKLAHLLSNRMVTSLPTAYPYRHDKLKVIGQGIDTELFSPKETELENPPMILCVGRLSPVKNHPTLLKAVHLLRQSFGRPFQVIILGQPATPQDEAYVQDLRNQVRELSLGGIVGFERAVPMANLPSWYRRCTVHVNLSPTGYGDKVVWEAMACGRPCIVANKGLRETLSEYADQLLFRHGDFEGLATRLRWVLNLSPQPREQLGFYLRGRVESLHSIKGLADRLVKIFLLLKEGEQK